MHSARGTLYFTGPATSTPRFHILACDSPLSTQTRFPPAQVSEVSHLISSCIPSLVFHCSGCLDCIHILASASPLGTRTRCSSSFTTQVLLRSFSRLLSARGALCFTDPVISIPCFHILACDSPLSTQTSFHPAQVSKVSHLTSSCIHSYGFPRPVLRLKKPCFFCSRCTWGVKSSERAGG